MADHVGSFMQPPARQPLTHVSLPNRHASPLPGEFAGDDVRLAESFIEYVLDRFSAPGERLLDPFAGFGTVLAVAERMGREAWGIEIDPRRASYARSLLRRPERLLIGDSRRIDAMQLPTFDLALVSPPYMCRGDVEDPISGYGCAGRGYDVYLDELVEVFRSVGSRVKDGGRIVVEVSNLKHEGRVTTLAWDLGLRLAGVFHFEGETVVAWDRYGYGYDHSYCLVYANRLARSAE
jgi:SAM-dependent methyltransferase